MRFAIPHCPLTALLLAGMIAAGCEEAPTRGAPSGNLGDDGAVRVPDSGVHGASGEPGGDAAAWSDAVVVSDAAQSCSAPEGIGPPNAFFVTAGAATGGTGTREQPFATLEEARDAIRELSQRPDGGIDVFLGAGIHRRASSFRLAAEDSGSAAAPIRYRGTGCEKARIVGGAAVSGWVPLGSGSVYDRLSREARGQVYVIDLSAQGITDYGVHHNRGASSSSTPKVEGPAPLELFFNGEPQHLARYPNVSGEGDNVWLVAAPGSGGHALVYEGTRPADRGWRGDAANGNPILVHGYLHYFYRDGLSTVLDIDTAKKTITITDTADGTVREDHPYFVYNVLEELDAPGEYWLDRADGKLYFWPPAPLTAGDETLVSLLEDPLVSLNEASHLVFERLQFEVARGHGVFVEGGESVTLDRCVIRNVGGTGLSMQESSNGPKVTNYVFRGGEVYAAGKAGIVIRGGSRSALIPAGNLVTDSHVHRWGRLIGRNGAGVRFGSGWFRGCGGAVQHSLIENGPGICVKLGGPLQTIEHNIIRNCAKDTGDLGAIYYGYIDPATRGISIRYNVIGDSYVRRKPWEGHGSKPYAINCIYVDNAGSGGHIAMNLIYNCDVGMLFNSGKFNHVENNILVGNKAARRATCRYREPQGKYNKGVQGMIDGEMHKRLWSANVRNWTDHSDPWTPSKSWADQLSPYDTLEELKALICPKEGCPSGSERGYRSDGEFVGNLSWRNGPHYVGEPYEGCPWNTDENNLDGVDPLFVDEEGGDFHLLPSSPASDLDPPFPVDEWNAMLDIVGPRS